MGCGASKVDPSIHGNENKVKPTSPGIINNKPKSLGNARPSSKTKLLSGRPSSRSGSLKLSDSPKSEKRKILVRDSAGTVRAKSPSSVNNEVERTSSGNSSNRDRVELFAAKPPTPVKTAGDPFLRPKPLAFEVQLDNKPIGMLPPRRLVSLSSLPKPRTEQEMKEKMRVKAERRELELQRKKLKSSRMSRRKQDLIRAQEQSKLQDQVDELKTKMQSTGDNKDRLRAERLEKQQRQKEHAQKVRERAKKLKSGDEFDEGLGGEMETYKSTSDDDTVNIWRASDDQEEGNIKPLNSKISRTSLDTIDSGVSKLKDESIDDFYDA